MVANTLRVNQDAFEAALPTLLKENVGKTAVFHDGELWGLYDDLQAAHAEALAEFGSDGIFLVAQIKEPRSEPVSFAFDLGLMFGEA